MKLSPEMLAAVEIAKANGGKLLRYSGGVWARKGWLGKNVDKWFSTLTVRALVARGVAFESDFKESGGSKFCVEITLNENHHALTQGPTMIAVTKHEHDERERIR